ncbi:CRISPR-associated endonuclease Cas3'' [Xylanibacillus composti]|uniref:CRISPR-associated endonuclease Cas3'' n=1 Tax=Xylanibacillus composti TaxID=1572762 RepID=UPI001BCC3335
MNYYAHTKKSGEYQFLRDHLITVANLCQRYAKPLGIGDLGYITGLLHDIGKYSALFQERIRGRNIQVNHSSAGAKWILDKDAYRSLIGRAGTARYIARLVSMAIAGHHGGLLNYGTQDQDGSFLKRMSKDDIPEWSSAWEEIVLPNSILATPELLKPEKIILLKDKLAWSYSFMGRMLYSCLVDADAIDTRNYVNDSDRLIMEKRERSIPTPSILLERLDNYLTEKFELADQTPVNLQRKRIQDICRRRALLDKGVFTLSVPTGGGKTLSSLLFALEHAKRHKMDRIIYVIPLTSIIEQNAQVFREAIGDDAVLEHHSNFNMNDYKENHTSHEVRMVKLSAENWDMPVIVTTSVQFFESLFSNKRSRCRKLHHIANSVIILDEAQSLPTGYLTPCLQALEELRQNYGCSVVLSTATQPSWHRLGVKATEIIDSPYPKGWSVFFDRVNVTVHGSNEDRMEDDQIIDWLHSSNQVLCIVTIKPPN